MVGGGWAGLAAAVRAAHERHHVTVFEASRQWGGRARSLPLDLPDGTTTTVDNGQHILIGAYSETLRLMGMVGVDLQTSLLRTPLALTDPKGHGLALPDWSKTPAWLNRRIPVAVLGGIAFAKGWSWHDKLSLLVVATRWRLGGFTCSTQTSVAQLCEGLPAGLRRNFIDPLCVSALNTPADRASGQVFLRVLRDALFGVPGGADLLLPRVDLATLFPEAAARWLVSAPRHSDLRLGQRVQRLEALADGWAVNGEVFDRVVWANSEQKSSLPLIHKALSAINTSKAISLQQQAWLMQMQALTFEPIATVYGWTQSNDTSSHVLPQPMTALWPDEEHPAQFAFDRSWLGGPRGLLAFVVSASAGQVQTIEKQVCAQAAVQLGMEVTPLRTVVEKRATFACTPGLERPVMHLAPGLVAAGDHVAGPYPATLEGAVRSGWAAGA